MIYLIQYLTIIQITYDRQRILYEYLVTAGLGGFVFKCYISGHRQVFCGKLQHFCARGEAKCGCACERVEDLRIFLVIVGHIYLFIHCF